VASTTTTTAIDIAQISQTNRISRAGPLVVCTQSLARASPF
jgi:hypothetical protein